MRFNSVFGELKEDAFLIRDREFNKRAYSEYVCFLPKNEMVLSLGACKSNKSKIVVIGKLQEVNRISSSTFSLGGVSEIFGSIEHPCKIIFLTEWN